MANQSTIPAVLAQLRATVAASGIYTASQVRISLEREPHPAPGAEFLLIAPAGFRPRGWADGGGRWAEVLDGQIRFRCHARKVNDSAPGDARALTDADSVTPPGLLVRSQQLLNLLVGRFVETDAGACLTAEQLRLLDHGESARYGTGREWIWVEVRLECSIHLDLDISSGD